MAIPTKVIHQSMRLPATTCPIANSLPTSSDTPHLGNDRGDADFKSIDEIAAFQPSICKFLLIEPAQAKMCSIFCGKIGFLCEYRDVVQAM